MTTVHQRQITIDYATTYSQLRDFLRIKGEEKDRAEIAVNYITAHDVKGTADIESRNAPAEVTDALAEGDAEIFENVKAGEASAVGEITIVIVHQNSRNLLERNADHTIRTGEADLEEDEIADVETTATEGAVDIAAGIDTSRITTRRSKRTKKSLMTKTISQNEQDAEATMRMDSPDPSAFTRRSSSTMRCRSYLGYQ